MQVMQVLLAKLCLCRCNDAQAVAKLVMLVMRVMLALDAAQHNVT